MKIFKPVSTITIFIFLLFQAPVSFAETITSPKNLSIEILEKKSNYQVGDIVKIKWKQYNMRDGFSIHYGPNIPRSWINNVYPFPEKTNQENGVYSWRVPKEVDQMEIKIIARGYIKNMGGFVETSPILISVGGGKENLGDFVPEKGIYDKKNDLITFNICNKSKSPIKKYNSWYNSLNYEVSVGGITRDLEAPKITPLDPHSCKEISFKASDFQIYEEFSQQIKIKVDVGPNGDDRNIGYYNESNENNNLLILKTSAKENSNISPVTKTDQSIQCKDIKINGKNTSFFLNNFRSPYTAKTADTDKCLSWNTVKKVSCSPKGLLYKNISCRDGMRCLNGGCHNFPNRNYQKVKYGLKVITPLDNHVQEYKTTVPISFWQKGLEYVEIDYIETGGPIHKIKTYRTEELKDGVNSFLWDTSDLMKNNDGYYFDGMLIFSFPESKNSHQQSSIEVPMDIFPNKKWFPRITNAEFSNDLKSLNITTNEPRLLKRKIAVQTSQKSGHSWSFNNTKWEDQGVVFSKGSTRLVIANGTFKNNKSLNIDDPDSQFFTFKVDNIITNPGSDRMNKIINKYGKSGVYEINTAFCLAELSSQIKALNTPACGDIYKYYISLDAPISLNSEPPPSSQKKETQPPSSKRRRLFSDVSEKASFYKAVLHLKDKGIVQGNPDGTFGPENPVNRAEAAKLLLLAIEDDFDTKAPVKKSNLTDIKGNEWYARYIDTAFEKGIINGYPDKTFRPANTINRAEFLKMLSLAFNLPKNLSYAYQDVNKEDWFSIYTGISAKYNLFSDDKLFLAPNRLVSRKEAVTAIYKVLKASPQKQVEKKRFIQKRTSISEKKEKEVIKKSGDIIHQITAKSPQDLFIKYQELGASYDSSVITLYADDAKIVNTRTYPSGETRVLELSGKEYKTLIKSTMPLAKKRGDRSTHSNINYVIENQRVRINSTRYSSLKDYFSKHSLLVEENQEGNWLIIEEISESQP